MTKNLLRNAVLSALLCLSAVPVCARKPKNFRLMKTNGSMAAGYDEPSVSTATVAQRVMAGRWRPEVRAALDRFIAERGRTSPRYDAARPPIAVFPWSDALVVGDPAELVFLRMTNEADFRFEDSWWDIVPVAQGRQPARAAYEHFIVLSSAVWQSQPDYHRYRKTILGSYIALCREVGRRECRPYLMRLWAGWKESEAVDYARQTLAKEKSRPAGVEIVRSEQEDKEPLRLRRGLRLIPEMRDMIAKLRGAGVDVWVVDDLPEPVLTASVGDYGIDSSRVYGVRVAPDGTRLSASVLKPIPTRGGKAEIVKASLGRPADLVIGRDAADIDLLSYGDGLRIILSGDAALEGKAREKGWLIQSNMAR